MPYVLTVVQNHLVVNKIMNIGASLDFGVFVCMNCSGAHRSLGQSVTRIKSTKLDTWTKDWIWHMQLNNKIINEYYEAVKGNLYNRQNVGVIQETESKFFFSGDKEICD